MTYPAPSHSAHIWVTGSVLNLGLPGGVHDEKGRTLCFPLPLSERSVAVLCTILSERSRSQDLGGAGSPWQASAQRALESDAKYQEWLSAMNAKSAEAQAAGEFLKELGL